jgi:beta-lactamase regulating signal transducer with metallopeptidase domain
MILFDKIGLILLHFVWQAAVIAVIAGLLLHLLKRNYSGLRYIICCLSLFLMVALPIIFVFSDLVKSHGSFDILSDKQLSRVEGQEVFYGKNLIGITFRTDQIQISSFEELINYLKRYVSFLSIAWMYGVILMTIYRLYGYSKIRSLIRQAQSVVDPSWDAKIKNLMQKIGIKRKIKILQSSLSDTPAVIGFLKPVLLFPVSFFTGVESAYIEAIILHELAHIKRFDYLVNIIQLIIETLGFFHPAVWWISGRIREERENCCDDFAVRILGDKLIYAKSLVQLEEKRQFTSLVTAANGSDLSHRVSRLLNIKSNIHDSMFLNFTAVSIFPLFLSVSLGFAFTYSDDGRLMGNLFKNFTNNELDEHLLAYFPFNGNANDESIFKQKTYSHNVTLCEDRFGRKNRAYDFNGINSYIKTDKKNVLNDVESFTISCWLYPRRAKNWESWICKDGIKWASEWRMGFGEDQNNEWGLTTCKLNLGRNYWANYWITNTKLMFDKWIHVAMSVDRKRNIVTVYMNGKKTGVIKDMQKYDRAEGSVQIGFQTDDNVYYDGKIDDIRIYNYVLSDAAVSQIYELD